MRHLARAALAALALAAPACEDHEFHPPDRQEQVRQAEDLFRPALFDSIAWPGRAQRLAAGSEVYAQYCRKCHGTLGRGDTDYALEHGLEVPSLVVPGGRLAADTAAVRRAIFTGHPAGMPTMSVARLTPREIDAVSFYLLAQLRPEVLEGRPRGDEGG